MAEIDNVDPIVSYLVTVIRKRNADNLKEGRGISEGEIKKSIAESPFSSSSKETLEEVERHLESHFLVDSKKGSTVASPHAPWLSEYEGNFAYWDRLRSQMLAENKLPTSVINRVDQSTDMILDYCGNPADKGSWKRRGMVMGHVQSGKTTNYGSLICKAADVGYKIIILLAGMTKDLRSQTQERMDEMFIGKAAEFTQVALSLHPIMEFDRFKAGHPAFGTTQLNDFSLPALKNYGVSLDNLKDPIIFVVKKNKSILENLARWMDSQFGGQKSEYPLLVIDDEADYASVNTKVNPELEATAINAGIRSLLHRFSRTTYIGYTATPFANIFIEPETEADMLKDEDLFPKHFIHSLSPPSNYTGASRVFGDGGDLNSAVTIVETEEFSDIIKLRHKKDLIILELPESLYLAIRTFILARAIRNLRNQEGQHATMMVNISRLVNIQTQVEALVYEYVTDLENSIRMHAMDRGWDGDLNMRLLKSALGSQFIDHPLSNTTTQEQFTADEILVALPKAVTSIEVRAINGAKPVQDLDYSQYKKRGKTLTVIAVGGNRLSRGLTLEGLCVSYMLRATGAADTLMQMARWFGYRPGYEDLCRIWLNEDAVSDFKYTHEAVEELREELKVMDGTQSTPEDFGLKVRRSETGIRITSQNKMRSAEQITWAQDFSGRVLDGYALDNNKATNNNNLTALYNLLKKLGPRAKVAEGEDESVAKDIKKHLVWRSVPAEEIVKMLEAFKFHSSLQSLAHIENNRSLFSDYVKERIGEFPKWDLVIPILNGADDDLTVEELFNSLKNRPNWLRGRDKGALSPINDRQSLAYKPYPNNNSIRTTGEDGPLLLTKQQRETVKSQRAIQQANDKKISLDRLQCLQRKRPLLISHLFKASLKTEDSRFELGQDIVVSCSFAMPNSSVVLKEKRYQINSVMARKMRELLEAEYGDDNEV